MLSSVIWICGLQGGIIIPLAPFGIPKYDRGERFDLKVRALWAVV